MGLVNPSGNRIGLDPVNETDKFLLIICAIAWSRPGPWENAVYLTAFLKEFDLFDVKAWSSGLSLRRLVWEPCTPGGDFPSPARRRNEGTVYGTARLMARLRGQWLGCSVSVSFGDDASCFRTPRG